MTSDPRIILGTMLHGRIARLRATSRREKGREEEEGGGARNGGKGLETCVSH